MSKSPFPPRQQAPLFAIRSCVADRANTVNRVEFENLKVVVNNAKEQCAQAIDKTNQVIEATNQILTTTKLFTIIFDEMYTFVYPTNTVYFSSMEPEQFMTCTKGYGVFGYFSGNWGYTKKPIQEIEFTWFDPVDPSLSTKEGTAPTLDELEQRPVAADNDPTDRYAGQQHIKKIPIYAYWCQAEEPPSGDIPDDRPPVPGEIDPIDTPEGETGGQTGETEEKPGETTDGTAQTGN